MLLKIFISSRNNDVFEIDGNKYDTLSEIRIFLKAELEKSLLFGKTFLEIIINESFGADTTLDSYNQCIQEVKESDFTIVLYNGSAGWAPTGVDLGICHAELSAALEISSKKTAILDISHLFQIAVGDPKEKIRDEQFKQYLNTLNRFTNPLKIAAKNRNTAGIKSVLLASIQDIISKHLSDRIKISNYYYNLSSNNHIALDWKKMKYEELARNIETILRKLVDNSPFFSKGINQIHSIPDNMAESDAKSRTGRPFLNDQETTNELIKSKKKKKPDSVGPIHFIGVYGKATETQVKKLIGHPDVSVIPEDFGMYVWDQTTHVQLIFLVECKTPSALKTKYILFENWCNTSNEYDNIINRGKARFHILKSTNEAKGIADGK